MGSTKEVGKEEIIIITEGIHTKWFHVNRNMSGKGGTAVLRHQKDTSRLTTKKV